MSSADGEIVEFCETILAPSIKLLNISQQVLKCIGEL